MKTQTDWKIVAGLAVICVILLLKSGAAQSGLNAQMPSPTAPRPDMSGQPTPPTVGPQVAVRELDPTLLNALQGMQRTTADLRKQLAENQKELQAQVAQHEVTIRQLRAKVKGRDQANAALTQRCEQLQFQLAEAQKRGLIFEIGANAKIGARW